jgi:hypothetical protein
MNNNNSTNLVKLPRVDLILNPDFITGLVESEGSFSITKHKDNRAKYAITIGLRFKITMLSNETDLLKMVKSFFNCGSIYYNKDGSVDFLVRDIKSLSDIVVPHFIKYPLRGTKYLDFLDFKCALYLIKSKQHYTKEGLDELIKISLTMNSFRQHVALYSPSHTVASNLDYIPLSGHYINGFIAGDGCLYLGIVDRNFCIMSLQITQHKNNRLLLVSIGNYFEYPSKVYSHQTNYLQLTLSGHKL